jgi:transcriptional antiterminator NusG
MNEEQEEQMDEKLNGTSASADTDVEPAASDAGGEDTPTPEAADDEELPADASADDAEAEAETDEEPEEAAEEMESVAEAEAGDEEPQADDADTDAEVEEEVAEPEPVAEAVVEEVAEAEAEADADETPEDDRKWYVVHCYSGYENKVRHAIEQRIETMEMQDKIFDVVVPTEEEIEVRDGKRRTVERRVFPGYILVQMLMGEDSWYVVRNTPGVTGFVGMGNSPTPLRPEEVSQIIKRMEAEAPKIKVTFKEGQKIRIIDGPFNDFIGTVAEIDMDKGKVRALVNFFGRDTPVELDFLQVEKA